jgi:hypothetical protein
MNLVIMNSQLYQTHFLHLCSSKSMFSSSTNLVIMNSSYNKFIWPDPSCLLFPSLNLLWCAYKYFQNLIPLVNLKLTIFQNIFFSIKAPMSGEEVLICRMAVWFNGLKWLNIQMGELFWLEELQAITKTLIVHSINFHTEAGLLIGPGWDNI